MDKCRLCLKYSKNLICAFDINGGKNFAQMITTIANVKVSEEDGLTNKICRACRHKTIEFYEFKLQVERSYLALQETSQLKKVNFRNFCDVNIFFELTRTESKQMVPLAIHEYIGKNSLEPFNYNETVIKKVSADEKSLSVIDLLKSIKTEPENCMDYDHEYEEAVDYDSDHENDLDISHKMPSKKKSDSKKIEKNKKKQNSLGGWKVLSKPVIPVYLNDYKVVSCQKLLGGDQNRKKRKYCKLDICPYCGKMTKSIKLHIAQHLGEKKFKCDKCTNAYVSRSSLSKHVERCHAPRNVKCDKCVAVFTNTTSLISHMLIHTNEKKQVCDICSSAFKRKSHLIRHVKLCHNLGEKPFKCELCPDTFNCKYKLNHHMRVHTGERPYKCEICSQPYSYKHDFNRHCLKKHGVSFKLRSVNVMNEEVLIQERILMRDLMLRMNGVIKDDKPINPFEGPHAARAFDHVIKAIQTGKIVVDLQF